MLLGFKKEFALAVQLGHKQTTIRAARKNAPRLGDTCHCYTGLQTKACRLLGRWKCVGVQPIVINIVDRPEFPLEVQLSDRMLPVEDMERLLTRDGFRPDHISSASQKARAFWGVRLPFWGHLITWDWTAEGAAPLAHNFRLGSTEGALTSTPAAELDEFYIENAAIHVERMGRSSFCLIIDAPGLPSVHINTGIAPGPEWYFNVWEDKLENPKQFGISRLIKPR